MKFYGHARKTVLEQARDLKMARSAHAYVRGNTVLQGSFQTSLSLVRNAAIAIAIPLTHFQGEHGSREYRIFMDLIRSIGQGERDTPGERSKSSSCPARLRQK